MYSKIAGISTIVAFVIGLTCVNGFIVFAAMFLSGIEGPIEHFSLIGMGATLAGSALVIPAVK